MEVLNVMDAYTEKMQSLNRRRCGRFMGSLLVLLHGTAPTWRDYERLAEDKAQLAEDNARLQEKLDRAETELKKNFGPRGGRAADGKARSREAKLLSFHLAKPQEDGSFRMFDKTLCGAIESASTPDVSPEPSAFAQRLSWRAIESGFDRAKVQVVTADGARSWRSVRNSVYGAFPRSPPRGRKFFDFLNSTTF